MTPQLHQTHLQRVLHQPNELYFGMMQASIGVVVCLIAEMDLDLVALILTKQSFFVRFWERMI
ncbi:unnamed protein product [Larinioides sclopetarius]|uniref:Uncharacterized protein n=1 Tax=Larinioides sclopetarius TaxID=280406 RepID=A0AAV1ZK58_9ARAC